MSVLGNNPNSLGMPESIFGQKKDKNTYKKIRNDDINGLMHRKQTETAWFIITFVVLWALLSSGRICIWVLQIFKQVHHFGGGASQVSPQSSFVTSHPKKWLKEPCGLALLGSLPSPHPSGSPTEAGRGLELATCQKGSLSQLLQRLEAAKEGNSPPQIVWHLQVWGEKRRALA